MGYSPHWFYHYPIIYLPLLCLMNSTSFRTSEEHLTLADTTEEKKKKKRDGGVPVIGVKNCWGSPLEVSQYPLIFSIMLYIQPTLDSTGDWIEWNTGHKEVITGHADSENRLAQTPTWTILSMALGQLLISPSLGCVLVKDLQRERTSEIHRDRGIETGLRGDLLE